MAMIEIIEFSTLEKIAQFIEHGNLKALIDKYFDEEPVYEFDHDLNKLYITFENYPFSVTIPNYDEEMSFFIKLNEEFSNDICFLGFVNKNTKIDDILMHLGPPDFSRDRLDNNTSKMVKYYIGKYSLAIDYDENQIIMASVFEDKYR